VDELEFPGSPDKPDWEGLYLYRGSEVVESRPIFTGDVFLGAEVQGIGAIESKDIIIIQHPCALRTNGVDLAISLMVAEITPGRLYAQSEWRGSYKLMPLPEMTGTESHYVAAFTSIYLAIPDSLMAANRVACLSPTGVNLLLQRWVCHNSRVVVPAWKYDEVVSAQYEEAEMIEEWCEIRNSKGVNVADATAEATAWLNDDGGSGVNRRMMLENSQFRAPIRKALRKSAKALNLNLFPVLSVSAQR
jgi:hypothetical protein